MYVQISHSLTRCKSDTWYIFEVLNKYFQKVQTAAVVDHVNFRDSINVFTVLEGTLYVSLDDKNDIIRAENGSVTIGSKVSHTFWNRETVRFIVRDEPCNYGVAIYENLDHWFQMDMIMIYYNLYIYFVKQIYIYQHCHLNLENCL